MKSRTLGWIDIPENRSGKFAIVHKTLKKGERVTMRSRRESLFGGGKGAFTVLPYNVRIHYLEEGSNRWASDHPQEVHSQLPLVKDFYGDVLVGGLGVGLILTPLKQNPKVKYVTVVEKSPDVIRLVWDSVSDHYSNVVEADLFDYLRECKRKGKTFDNGYFNIWCPNGEDVLFTHIRPLRELSKGVVKDKLTCWQEDVMTGQLRFELVTSLATLGQMPGYVGLSEERFDAAYKHSRTRWPFWAWYRAERPGVKKAQKMAELYAKDYAFSTPAWQKTFGKHDRRK